MKLLLHQERDAELARLRELLPAGGATAAARLGAASRGEPRSTSPEASEVWGEPVEMANGPPKMWKFGRFHGILHMERLKKPMGNYTESYGNDAVKPYGNMWYSWKMILVAFFKGQRSRNPMVLQWQHLSLWIPQGWSKARGKAKLSISFFQLFTYVYIHIIYTYTYTYYIYIFSSFFSYIYTLYLYIYIYT